MLDAFINLQYPVLLRLPNMVFKQKLELGSDAKWLFSNLFRSLVVINPMPHKPTVIQSLSSLELFQEGPSSQEIACFHEPIV